ncbi:hypothetical protein N9F76_01640, partial [bacterium]|nr:hypothetical protein [bacterium]
MAQSNVNNPELSKQKILDHIVDVNDKSVSIISHCYDAGSSLIHDGAVVRIVSGLDTAVAVAEGELLSADTDVTIAQASMSSYKFGDKVVYSSEAYE